METLTKRMRVAAGYNGAPVGERQALLSEGADTIEALLSALEAIANIADWESTNPKMAGAVRYARAAIALATVQS